MGRSYSGNEHHCGGTCPDLIGAPSLHDKTNGGINPPLHSGLKPGPTTPYIMSSLDAATKRPSLLYWESPETAALDK
jgi:hypothetical protein